MAALLNSSLLGVKILTLQHIFVTIWNMILIPPIGTILSGFSILCCGECRVQTKDDQRLVTLCANVCVGVSQLFTVTFLLVGWFWSIAWGINMVTLAVELRRRKKQQREIELQKRAVNAFGENVQRSFFAGMK